MSFKTLPHQASIHVVPFTPHIADAQIEDLHARLDNVPTIAKTWDNTNGPAHLGTSGAWIDDMIKRWKAFDWRAVEAEIASFPSYKATVEYRGHKYDIHFLALFSEKRDATPIVFSHGWPGSVLEFVPMLKHLKKTYTPSTLPNHVLVPALVGYGFSTKPSLDFPFSARDNAAVVDLMMEGLGFGREGNKGGYYAQGGDIGSFVTRQLSRHDNCLGIHLNFLPMGVPKGMNIADLDEQDQKGMARAKTWSEWGQGYRLEHSTRPATIGAVLDSSPVAVLAWIGEKLEGIQIADRETKVNWLLADVSLYWYTNTASSCLWEYRAAYGRDKLESSNYPEYISKPTGYSLFAGEIMPTPIPFVKKVTNLVSAHRHAEGAHFAALEQPVVLWNDVQEFVKAAGGSSAKL